MKPRTASWLLGLGAMSWGCAYYNGLYNANRLAKDAARASRQGRPGEARARWQEAAIKAESVAIRFPHSKYHDDALLLQGRALIQAGDFAHAALPLAVAIDSSTDPLIRRDATLLLGQCRVSLNDFPGAFTVLTPLVTDKDPRVARAARTWRARASVARGDYASALEDLGDASDTATAFYRAAALIGSGRVDEGVALLVRLAPSQDYDEHPWLRTLDQLGTVAPDRAAELVDSLSIRQHFSSGARARMLLADANRWEQAGHPERLRKRLQQVSEIATDSLEGQVAGARLVLLDVREVRDLARLPDIVDRLRKASTEGAEPEALAAAPLAILAPVVAPGEAAPTELDRFFIAEEVRDSLGAPLLAAALFRGIQRDFPSSPYAPKALLAAAALDPDSASTVTRLLDSLYYDSPYRLGLNGNDAPGFTRLEDSLRTARDPARAKVESPPKKRAPGPIEQRRPRPSTGRQIPEP